ncbi:MAG: hypothetical protein WA057_03910 [Candidatus Magasanikiibacteriota bacterium]
MTYTTNNNNGGDKDDKGTDDKENFKAGEEMGKKDGEALKEDNDHGDGDEETEGDKN